MKSIYISPSLKIPVLEYASQGNAILGIRDSGKSYSATYIAEQLLNAGIPFVALDPVGVWRNLKVAGKGAGYNVVVAGDDADLPLTPQSAPEIVRAAMRENISLVLDLYSMKLSKADWRSIVQKSVEILLYENKSHGLRHIFIEEAAEFCPQQVGPESGRVYAEIEKLARMGGNASLGYTLINQRSEQINKAVLELCDCLFLHRQKGKNSLTSLGKWLDFADPAMSKTIIQSLPTLTQGECWIWLPGSTAPTRVKMPEKRTFHPDRRNPQKIKTHAVADTSEFVTKMKGSLEKVLAEVKLNDPAELKKQIKTLERQLACESNANKSVAPTIKEVPMFSKDDESQIMQFMATVDSTGNILLKLQKDIDECRIFLNTILATIRNRLNQLPPVQRPALRVSFPTERTAHSMLKSTDEELKLGQCEKAILRALMQYRRGRTDTQIALLTGYSVTSGSFKNSLSKLRTSCLIDRGSPIVITQIGADTIGSDWEPLPTGQDLLNHWLVKLGKCEASILRELDNTATGELTVLDLAANTGYSPDSGSFKNSLSYLRGLELIQRGQPIRISEDFYQ